MHSHPGDAWDMEVAYVDGADVVEGDPVVVLLSGALCGRHEISLTQDVELISAG